MEKKLPLEAQLIHWLETFLPPPPKHIPVGIGDDCAVITPQQKSLLLAKDQLLEEVHFTAQTPLFAVGYKAVGVNLSDIAAMGGRALGVLISLAIPRHMELEALKLIYQGAMSCLDRFKVPIIGGDTNCWDGPLSVSVTVFGEALHQPVLRQSAQPKDTLAVTGPLGNSLERGSHLEFIPRLEEIKQILEVTTVHAMMDISDGLATDLRRLGEQSQKAIYLNSHSIPLHESLNNHPKGLKKAMCDGEDFELVLSLSQESLNAIHCMLPNLFLKPIGWVEEGSGLYWQNKNPISWNGYEHH